MKNINNKGTASSALKYTGIVTLSQYTGSKKTVVARSQNKGGKALFSYLADCLVGHFDVASVSRPTKIMLLSIDDTGKIEKAVNSRFITLLMEPEKKYDDKEGIVRYSFIIPQDLLIGTAFNAIGLYLATATEADLDDYAACCSIALDRTNISLSSVLVLDWELHISNI